MDLSKITEQFAAVVKEQLEVSGRTADKAESESRLAAAIFSKPFLLLPNDLMAVFGIGKTTAYELMKRDTFPRTFSIGRQRFCKTEEFVACLGQLGE